MSNNNSSSSSGGIGFIGLLTIVFVVLRLIPTGDPAKHQHLINWSWWWVLSPLWISALLTLGILAIVLVIWVLVMIYKDKHKR